MKQNPNGPSISHLAARAVMERPLSESLQKLRRAQRALVRVRHRNKVRVSFPHSASNRSFVGNPQKAKGNSQVGIGKNITMAERHIEAPAKQQEGQPGGGEQTHRVDHQVARLSREGGQAKNLDTVAKADPTADPTADSRYSLMHVVESEMNDSALPRLSLSARTQPETRDGQDGCQHPEYAHVGPLESINLPDYSAYSFSPDSENNFSVRRSVPIELNRLHRSARVPHHPLSSYYMYAVNRASTGFNIEDPAILASMSRSLSQQRRLSSIAPPDNRDGAPGTGPKPLPAPNPATADPAMLPDGADVPFRSSSQDQEVRRFTRRLEKFSRISGAPGQPPIATPTVTSTPPSLNTIQELLPYREQFEAAGLAVTSKDQRSPKKPNDSQLDGAAKPGQPSSHKNSPRRDGVIAFVKPDALRSVFGGEKAEKKETRTRGTPSTRKILPWLQRKAPIPTTPKVVQKPKGIPGSTSRPSEVSSKDKPLPHRPTSMLRANLQRREETKPEEPEKDTTHPPPPDIPPPPVPGQAAKPEKKEEVYATHFQPRDSSPPPLPIKAARPGRVENSKPTTIPLPQDTRPPPVPSKAARPEKTENSSASFPPTAVPRPPAPSKAARLEKAENGSAVFPPTATKQPKPLPSKSNQIEGVIWVERAAKEKPDKEKPVLPTATKRLPEKRQGAVFASSPKKPPGTGAWQVPPTVLAIGEQPGASPDKKRRGHPATAGRSMHDKRLPDSDRVLMRTPDKDNKHRVSKSKLRAAKRDHVRTQSSAPSLPETWTCDLSTSSFEKALDDVVRKLEAMDGVRAATGQVPVAAGAAAGEKPQPPSKRNSGRAALSPSEKLERASALRRKRMEEKAVQTSSGVDHTRSSIYSVSTSASTASAEVHEQAAQEKRHPRHEATDAGPSAPRGRQDNAHGKAVEYYDLDLVDRDVMKGLKLATSAACDEDLDAWICANTGLRLRRFLADLKTFEDLELEWLAGAEQRKEREEARQHRAERRTRVLEELRNAPS